MVCQGTPHIIAGNSYIINNLIQIVNVSAGSALTLPASHSLSAGWSQAEQVNVFAISESTGRSFCDTQGYMPSKSRQTGNVAEDAVVKYAKDNGWKIVARNFEKPWGEIDIVARDKSTILFIEVKSGTSEYVNFSPEDNFDKNKRNKFIRACRSCLLENDYSEDTDWRIDLAAVDLDFNTGNSRIRYYKNAIG